MIFAPVRPCWVYKHAHTDDYRLVSPLETRASKLDETVAACPLFSDCDVVRPDTMTIAAISRKTGSTITMTVGSDMTTGAPAVQIDADPGQDDTRSSWDILLPYQSLIDILTWTR